jgi:hypothetical protein
VGRNEGRKALEMKPIKNFLKPIEENYTLSEGKYGAPQFTLNSALEAQEARGNVSHD